MAEDEAALTSGVARDLAALRWHWSGAYEITVHRSGRWRATRTDNGGKLEAESAEELRQAIHQDYNRRRVARP